MATNNQKAYRTKLQGVIKKLNDAVRDVELVTMSNLITDQDRDIFLTALDQQTKKIKAALRSEPAALEIEWPEEDEVKDVKESKVSKEYKPPGFNSDKPNDSL